MRCAHCLRGEQENKDINLKAIDAFLENNGVSSINEVSFTGGEPSLNPKAISYFIDSCKKHKVDVYSFQIITNGKRYTQEFISTIEKLENFCGSDLFNKMIISDDIWHIKEGRNKKEIKKLNMLDSFRGIQKEKPKEILHMGRAKSLKSLKGYMKYQLKKKKMLGGDRIYINVNGDILTHMDLSYDLQEKEEYNLGSVFDLPHYKMIRKYRQRCLDKRLNKKERYEKRKLKITKRLSEKRST